MDAQGWLRPLRESCLDFLVARSRDPCWFRAVALHSAAQSGATTLMPDDLHRPAGWGVGCGHGRGGAAVGPVARPPPSHKGEVARTGFGSRSTEQLVAGGGVVLVNGVTFCCVMNRSVINGPVNFFLLCPCSPHAASIFPLQSRPPPPAATSSLPINLMSLSPLVIKRLPNTNPEFLSGRSDCVY